MPGGVNSERMQLVKWNPLLPARAKLVHRQIPIDDVREHRTAEQLQHCQIGFAMSAVRRRIDHHRTHTGPYDVAGPEITVDSAGNIAEVERAFGDHGADTFDVGRGRLRDISDIDCHPQIRNDSLGDVERTPRGVFDARHGPRSDEHLTVETVR